MNELARERIAARTPPDANKILAQRAAARVEGFVDGMCDEAAEMSLAGNPKRSFYIERMADGFAQRSGMDIDRILRGSA